MSTINQRVSAKARGRRVRSPLTLDEIYKIAIDWKNDDGPGGEDIKKLIRMIRFQNAEIERLNVTIFNWSQR